MCLILKDSSSFINCNVTTINIASEDILVYKVLRYNKITRMYYTPFIKTPIRNGSKLYFERLKSDIRIEVNLIIEGDRSKMGNVSIYHGIHSYTSIDRAKNICDAFVDFYIFEAYIPKGSQYFLGTRSDIVSNELVIRKGRVNPEKERCEMSKKSSM